jgi:hypothetical protein
MARDYKGRLSKGNDTTRDLTPTHWGDTDKSLGLNKNKEKKKLTPWQKRKSRRIRFIMAKGYTKSEAEEYYKKNRTYVKKLMRTKKELDRIEVNEIANKLINKNYTVDELKTIRKLFKEYLNTKNQKILDELEEIGFSTGQKEDIRKLNLSKFNKLINSKVINSR